ncbi:hypothetical protein DL93DRAFT_2086561 [Clavulina sp. PMI_390]|nr:hypothetical protein DL93DRAFT_2086561 [Clavulina sp. PMI_390]
MLLGFAAFVHRGRLSPLFAWLFTLAYLHFLSFQVFICLMELLQFPLCLGTDFYITDEWGTRSMGSSDLRASHHEPDSDSTALSIGPILQSRST